MEIPAAKRAIGRECFDRLSQKSYMSSMNNEPNDINKQDKNTDTQYKDKHATDTVQKLFEAGDQKVCNDENDDRQDNQKE
jgi:hypothetical protein